MKNEYVPVIGLEIHVELSTASKMFCRCSADYFGKEPNTHVCPVCFGLPGAMPVPNKKAIEWTMLIGKALNCTINTISKFDRKHYFYPDLPKGYQISQYDEPFCINGHVVIANGLSFPRKRESRIPGSGIGVRDDSRQTFRIHRVHLEEDTGKLIHRGNDTLVDFNRSGVPLVEIVTEPDFDNVTDVKRFLEELQVIIRYLGVSDADMEKGSMRLEPNISVQKFEIRNSKFERKLPPYKVEVKNINSFNFVKRAIEYEVKRQIEILKSAETPIQETRGYDEDKGITVSQRTKEEAHDYRYFPEPDIPAFEFSEEYRKTIESQLPELPTQKMTHFIRNYQIKEQDAYILTRDIKTAEYFEKVVEEFVKLKHEADVKVKTIRDGKEAISQGQIIANLIVNKKIPTDIEPKEFALRAIPVTVPFMASRKVIEEATERVMMQNAKVVEEYKSGKGNAINVLIGSVIKEMKGKVNAAEVREVLIRKLSS